MNLEGPPLPPPQPLFVLLPFNIHLKPHHGTMGLPWHQLTQSVRFPQTNVSLALATLWYPEDRDHGPFFPLTMIQTLWRNSGPWSNIFTVL